MSKRMFNTDIVNSDVFLEMPPSTQSLYFHLGMHCDDDGFVYPKKIVRMVGAADDDLKLLLAKKFFLIFESGIVVQKHWKVNNYIRPDRYHPSPHREEMALLSLDKGMVYHLVTKQLPIGVQMSSRSKEVSKKVKGDFSKEKVKNEENPGTRELTHQEQIQKISEMKESLRQKKVLK